jgi:glycosyltransferase involved in cell wall biosynthesis
MPYADYSAYQYSRKRGVPLVVTYHADAPETGGSALRNGLQRFYNRHLLPRVLEEAEVIITTSQSYMEDSPHLPVHREKIRVLPNGIHPQEFQTTLTREECREKLDLPQDRVIILFFGNLVPYKGPEVLLNAFKMVREDYEKVMLLYVGRGSLQGQLQEMSQGQEVHFAGHVSDPEKATYYQAADIFSLPSVTRAEAFGIVNLEAMASGLPIVASRLGGIPDIVREGENGLLFQPGNVEELARAIRFLLDNPDERERMGRAGRRMVEDYSWTRIARETEKIYQELLEGGI